MLVAVFADNLRIKTDSFNFFIQNLPIQTFNGNLVLFDNSQFAVIQVNDVLTLPIIAGISLAM